MTALWELSATEPGYQAGYVCLCVSVCQATWHSCLQQLDLFKGYYKVPVVQQDVPKMVVITIFGLFEFMPMPFELWKAGQSFK